MTDFDIGFLAKIDTKQIEQSIKVAISILLKQGNIGKNLPQSQRVFVTKICKLLENLCKVSKKSLGDIIDKLPAKDAFKEAFRQLHFDRQLNNYLILKSYFNKQPLPDNQRRIELTTSQEALCVKVEYRIEIVLSSHKNKKVFKPLILLIFHMSNGTMNSFYSDIAQFEEIRKQTALVIKSIHQIQAKG